MEELPVSTGGWMPGHLLHKVMICGSSPPVDTSFSYVGVSVMVTYYT